MRYFHSLDSFRFLAFFLVFVHHFPFQNDSVFKKIAESGGLGVQLFFILSGFLITSIILNEKEKKGDFKIKNFLIRRILRIWPLYFAMVFFAFVTPYILQFLSVSTSDDGYEPNWLFSLLFLENYQMMITNMFPNVSPLTVMWSLCIEEHFYIFWGVIFYFLNRKQIGIFLIGSIIFSLITRVIYSKIGILDLDLFSNMIYFSSGGLLAYILQFYSDKIEILDQINPILKRIIALLIVIGYWSIPNLKINTIILEPLMICISTILLLGFTLSSRNPIKISDKNVFNRLGKYTYGMYLFHTIWINLLMKFIDNNFVLFLSSLICTIVSSMISYYYFESYFLKFKHYFR